jgi:hypothetical protein
MAEQLMLDIELARERRRQIIDDDWPRSMRKILRPVTDRPREKENDDERRRSRKPIR